MLPRPRPRVKMGPAMAASTTGTRPSGRLSGALLALLVAACAPDPARAPEEERPLASREVLVDPARPPPADGGLVPGELALTFDDGPHPLLTRRLLAVLGKYGVKAVFFQVGRNAEASPDVTREIVAQGHALGSHSFDHPDLAGLPFGDATANIRRGHEAVERAAGVRTPLFRYPMFSSTAKLQTALPGLGLVPLFANIVTEDWKTPDGDALLEKSLAMVEREGRGILLFHDIQPVTSEVLDRFLAALVARRYRTVVLRPPPRP